MDEKKPIEDSLIEVIGNSGGSDILQEVAELGLDRLLQDGILRDIPVVSTLVNLVKTTLGIQGYIFTKKLYDFLINLSSIPHEQRIDFQQRLDSDPKFRKQVSENLLLLIDRLDDMAKPELLAMAFAGYIRGRYDFTTFHRLAIAIDRCIVYDLEELKVTSKGRMKIDPHKASVLSSAGLVEIEVIPQVRGEGVRNIYNITGIGKLFVEYVLK